ncbi:Galactosylgalactosylxylosylprotein 3-beta-glucuronosyltransferase [Aphelenchoides fujianensis]|nr:Galactosylgalactosylxylosylprotein 3-beta-glucuronosyltransferase [Aphelenchoides fujianensis]
MFPDQWPSVKVRFLGRRLAIALGLLLAFCTYAFLVPLRSVWPTPSASSLPDTNGAIIFVITPTYPRPERFADMTRTTQTLMQVSNLFWIVVEDGEARSPVVQRMLDRSGIPHVYLNTTSNPALPVHRGWTQRNFALTYLRENYAEEKRGVVYFADDDNAYDVRMFNQYIRRVKKIGFWAVGFSGGGKVEAPHVENGTITKWDTIYEPDRKFATDMAGFAVNIRLILNSNASFGKQCNKNPEDCFLRQLGVNVSEAEPFGHDSEPKELLVWHTKSSVGYIRGASYDYAFETRRPPPTKPTTVKKALNQTTTRFSARPRRRASRPST